MLLFAKAVSYGTLAGFGLATFELVAQAQGFTFTGSPVIDGVGGGAVITAAMWAVYKYKVDRLTKEIEDKAHRNELLPLAAQLNRIERKVESINRYLLEHASGGTRLRRSSREEEDDE